MYQISSPRTDKKHGTILKVTLKKVNLLQSLSHLQVCSYPDVTCAYFTHWDSGLRLKACFVALWKNQEPGFHFVMDILKTKLSARS